MVEKSTLTRKIDARLRSMRGRIESLSLYAERYGASVNGSAAAGRDLDALHYERLDTLDRLDSAQEWFLAGDMNDEQAERHRRNLLLLAEQVPVIRQLGLKMPNRALVASHEGSAAPGS